MRLGMRCASPQGRCACGGDNLLTAAGVMARGLAGIRRGLLHDRLYAGALRQSVSQWLLQSGRPLCCDARRCGLPLTPSDDSGTVQGGVLMSAGKLVYGALWSHPLAGSDGAT